jgi:hypothetical protein
VEFVIEMRVTGYIAHQADLDDEDMEWRAIRCECVGVPTDCGLEVGLTEVGQGDFLDSLAPLVLAFREAVPGRGSREAPRGLHSHGTQRLACQTLAFEARR